MYREMKDGKVGGAAAKREAHQSEGEREGFGAKATEHSGAFVKENRGRSRAGRTPGDLRCHRVGTGEYIREERI